MNKSATIPHNIPISMTTKIRLDRTLRDLNNVRPLLTRAQKENAIRGSAGRMKPPPSPQELDSYINTNI